MKSFDLFDTLITRDLYKPSDIFYFVGKYAKSINLVDLDEDEFKKKRIDAEALARTKSTYEEITLDEIYLEFATFLNCSDDVLQKIKKIEKKIEKNSFCIIEENVKNFCSSSIVITDTYHSKEFINQILLDLDLKAKELFVSSEYKKMKHYGSLYDEVLKAIPLKKHTGDNRHSDYKKALEKNIESTLYLKSRPTRYEISIYNSDLPYELRAVLSGVMKSTRLQTHYDNDHFQVIHEVSTNVIAPFLYSYVNWILKEAKSLKIDTLFYIARDGQILFEIAKIIKHNFKLNIELKYLYGSRKAWHLPAVTEINEEVLDWIFDPTHFLSLEDICSRAEIEITTVKNILNLDFSNNQNLNIKDRNFLKNEFSKNIKIHALIIESANKKRKSVIEYLTQEGFQTDKKIAIVDVGWRGRQQVSLSKLLSIGGIYPKSGLLGFYVSLTNPVQSILNDKVISFLDKEKYKDILSFPGIYENFVAADHGSCVGYQTVYNAITPILREDKNNKMIDWGLNIQQQSILRFTDNLATSLLKYNVSITNEQEISYGLLRQFLKHPSFDEANAFGKIKLFEDQEEKMFFYLCELISKRNLFKLLFFRNALNHNTWTEGSIAISFKGITKRIILKLLEVRKIIRNLLK